MLSSFFFWVLAILRACCFCSMYTLPCCPMSTLRLPYQPDNEVNANKQQSQHQSIPEVPFPPSSSNLRYRRTMSSALSSSSPVSGDSEVCAGSAGSGGEQEFDCSGRAPDSGVSGSEPDGFRCNSRGSIQLPPQVVPVGAPCPECSQGDKGGSGCPGKGA